MCTHTIVHRPNKFMANFLNLKWFDNQLYFHSKKVTIFSKFLIEIHFHLHRDWY